MVLLEVSDLAMGAVDVYLLQLSSGDSPGSGTCLSQKLLVEGMVVNPSTTTIASTIRVPHLPDTQDVLTYSQPKGARVLGTA